MFILLKTITLYPILFKVLQNTHIGNEERYFFLSSLRGLRILAP